MTTGQLFDQAIAVAKQQGFEVRFEHLGGSGTGYCRVGERRWLVVDVAQPMEEQLEQLAAAIASEPIPNGVRIGDDLRQMLDADA
ncbi:hypothetical protein NG895_17195 [Aeoliella sp. ICT_H6.2]|uniref:Uncharacterized protein n=1 Tax=Aeoliella straminimaris TaxID=2954799 RepID=A0A9X2FH44_9BACT|nr:hypothetical protein [Aeoliella straminimaris]MCO6045636.1 hypothetical protein [Aeoliella straminimaris]